MLIKMKNKGLQVAFGEDFWPHTITAASPATAASAILMDHLRSLRLTGIFSQMRPAWTVQYIQPLPDIIQKEPIPLMFHSRLNVYH